MYEIYIFLLSSFIYLYLWTTMVFQVLSATEGQNPARQAAIYAGIPIQVPAYQINMLCGSSLRYAKIVVTLYSILFYVI